MVAAAKKYASEGVIFLGVDDREKTPLVQVWAKSKGVRESGATANADLAQEALQRGQVAEDREQFADAYAFYAKAVSLDAATASDASNGEYLAAIEQYAAREPAAIAVTVSGASSAHAAPATPAKLWVLVRNPSDVSRSVNLAAAGLPQHWLLSFCYAKVCQPNKSTINLAAGGSLRVELQVVPLAGSGGAWTMHVAASGGPTARVQIAAKSLNATATVSATSGT